VLDEVAKAVEPSVRRHVKAAGPAGSDRRPERAPPASG
jgi:hypothetical protein